jgi:molybdate/tungstate transport system substrate-binding protein
MTNQIKPAFQAATGYTFNGVGAGSSALASGIKSGVYQADVFISAATAPDASLMGAGNGNWISWYAPFATSALVLGYDVSSTFAPALTSRPWYEVVAMPGFRIGRTDPKTDPKGVLAAQAITETVADAASLPGANAAALNAIVASTKNVYDETGEVALMETHQLDGAFLYTIEAQAAGSTIKTVPLTGPAQGLHATYTITILNRAPHGKAAEAFVNFLLGPTGKAFLTNDAFALASPPQVTGTGVPAGVSSVIHG